MSDLGLGKVIEGDQQRDAIHVAVCPVVASHNMRPGAHVGFVDGSRELVAYVDNTIGVIDPFFPEGTIIKKGQRIFLFLYPGSITSLRHDWTHPAFSDCVSDAVARSETRLREIADMLEVHYEDVISPNFEVVCGDYINNGEDIRDLWYDVQEEFWLHRKVVTGEDVPEDHRGGFTCSC